MIDESRNADPIYERYPGVFKHLAPKYVSEKLDLK